MGPVHKLVFHEKGNSETQNPCDGNLIVTGVTPPFGEMACALGPTVGVDKWLILTAWWQRVIFILHSVDKQCALQFIGGRDKIIIGVKRKEKEGLYNKQKQIWNNNKQWNPELIKPLHYKLQLWIINKQMK